jgi:hypothetical protein
MARLTAQEFQEKHARRLKGASEDIRRGIERVTVAPTALAAAKQEKMKTKLNARIDDGTWARRLKAVSLQDWQTKAKDVGIGRISAGIDSASQKVQDFAAQLLPAVDAAQAKIKGMPDVTLEDSISRMTTFTREMSKFKKR